MSKQIITFACLCIAIWSPLSAETPAAGQTTGAKADKMPEGKAAIKDLTAKEVKDLLASDKGKGIAVLDVRTKEEFALGHIEGAKNIDFRSADFEKSVSGLDKSKPLVVHCQSGRRSSRSMDVFSKLGFTNMIHMKDGFSAWTSAGGAVTK